jgi:hypothetical protein
MNIKLKEKIFGLLTIIPENKLPEGAHEKVYTAWDEHFRRYDIDEDGEMTEFDSMMRVYAQQGIFSLMPPKEHKS